MLDSYKFSLKEIDYIIKRISDTLMFPFYSEIYIRKPYENSISYILHCCYNLEDFVIMFNIGVKTKCDINDLSDYLKDILLNKYKERMIRNEK